MCCCQGREEASEGGVDIVWNPDGGDFWLHHADHGDIVTVERCPWCGKPLEIEDEETNEDPTGASPVFIAGDLVCRVLGGRPDRGEEGIIIEDIPGCPCVQWLGPEAYNESLEEAGELFLIARPLGSLDVETMVNRAKAHLEAFCKLNEEPTAEIIRLHPRVVR